MSTDSQPPDTPQRLDASGSLNIPRSATGFALSFIAMLAGLIAAGLAQHLWPNDPENALLCGGGAIAAVIALVDLVFLKSSGRASSGLAAHALRPVNLAEAGLRFLGLLLTLATIGLVYWLFPEYHGTFYQPYWHLLQVLALPMLCLAPLYFLWTGTRLMKERDPYLQLGRLLLGRGWDRLDREALRAHWLAWTVKAFFLPLMVVYAEQRINSTGGALRALSWDTWSVYQFFYELSFLIDLLYCVLGYLLTLRILDTQVRSTEPTVFGWVVALVCYQPFYSVIGNFYLKYDEFTIGWQAWLSGFPAVQAAWAVGIVVLTMIYALSTVAFGLRFSNLTHRGIITSGPYRFTKHPAYLSKNLSWWLISVPFISHIGLLDAVRHCVLLAFLNLIYFLRARTEERHLSRDPAYLAYSRWMDEHGMFSKLKFWPRERGSPGALHDRVGNQELTLNERATKLERRAAARSAGVVSKKGRRGK
jgi:protein-S-isoprenylcysteine O-methyltransferase Ste14